MISQDPEPTFWNVINGQTRGSQQTRRGTDPRLDQPIWPCPVASTTDLDDAVAAAQTAFRGWADTDIARRQKVLLDLADMLCGETELMSGIICKETGKSRFMGELEVEHSINFLRFNASQSLPEETLHEDDSMKIISTHVPIGVVAAICPWNFPLVLATAKIAAALVTGNCIIVKPSPFTPYSTLKFAELAARLLPPGVFQALNGENELGERMTLHPGIDKISFTGSTKTGQRIMENAAKTLKKVTLELGGNDATIVFPDVVVGKVAAQVAVGCFFNAGQMCVATKRVYVHEDIYEEFRASMVNAVRGLMAAPDSESVLGPLQNRMQHAVVQKFLADSRELLHDFALGEDQSSLSGLFINPTIIDRPPDDAALVQEEQFGPIVPLLSWKTEEDVLRRVNNTESGLGACVWSMDREKAERFGRRLEVGSLWINSFEKPHPAGYFSGHKKSGIGGEWGRQGLLSYCNTQTIHVYKS
ncbi:aldehyde dehydrogenase domain-containing protein [Aspergillus pseudodeflectus]|uniref:aldehyde dehydrogenase (NAD(+)) n=1 Tax=Aspergillus pseudodeflectus TaxID=176178 RepID=A0ABR4K485_9EURO